METPPPTEASPTAPAPSAFWPCAWLTLVLIGAKAAHWGWPELSPNGLLTYARDWAVSTHADVLFAVGLFLAAEAALLLTRGRPAAGRAVSNVLLTLGVVCAIYAVASVQIFAFLRSPLTYPLLYLAGDMKNMRSSVGSFVSPGVAAALVIVPLGYVFVVRRSSAAFPTRPTRRYWYALTLAVAVLLGYAHQARAVAEGRWSDRADVLIAQSPHWVIAASLVDNALGSSRDRSIGPFEAADLADFDVPGHARLPTAAGAAGRPRNVLLVVLESTSARWLSLYGSPYATTPHLDAEAAHAVTFDAFYSHVGLTANSMAAMTLSLYPYMTWREYTVEYPDFPGVALGNLLKPRGFRTAFLHPGDLGYVGQERFLKSRGFDAILDLPELPPSRPVSSWGGEDRVLVDGLLNWIDQDRGRPFYAVAWTTQSHHPYEPVPGQPIVDFFKGNLPPDDYDLGRYLNTIAEVDRQLGRLFAGLRERGLADDTLIVITGDHGEAFGHPHPTWGHGFRLYDESVRIPLVLWNPRLFAGGKRSTTVGGHVDVNPTVADLLGIPAPASWEGRSLFAPDRPPRVYFYAANDDYLMGVREGWFKYIYNVSRGREELYDLQRDPDEQTNVAAEHPDRCLGLRRRLAAWKDHVGRHLARARESGKIGDRS